MMRCVKIAFAGLAVLACAAAPARAGTTGTLSASYDGYAHGVLALRLTASISFTPTGYSGRLEYHTAGMIGWMVRSETDSQAEGRFAGGVTPLVAPLSYYATGFQHGTNRVTRLAYTNGNPVVRTLEPPVAGEREAVPEEETRGAIDSLSAIALLLRQAGQTGHCDGAVRTFDGRRLSTLTAHTVGDAALPPQRNFGFDGHALQCDFAGRLLAGFEEGKNPDEQRRERHGSAWLAPLVAGAPPVPVKVVFENPTLGWVTLRLTSVSGSGGAVAVR